MARSKVRFTTGAMGGLQARWDGSDMSLVWFGPGSRVYLVMPVSGGLVPVESVPVPADARDARRAMRAFIEEGGS